MSTRSQVRLFGKSLSTAGVVTLAVLVAKAAVALLLLDGCKPKEAEGLLSSATLESDLWKVSPTASGTLLAVNVREGDSIAAGAVLATIDSVPLLLKLGELQAGRTELTASLRAREAEIATLQATHTGIAREAERAQKLVAEGAAPAQRQDDLETQRNASLARIAAARAAVEALRSKGALLTAQEKSLRDQISRCSVTSPASGRILTRYRNAGEAALPGRPLVEIGKTDTLWADFFVGQQQLAKFKLGQALRLRLDTGGEPLWIPAKLTWISTEAEFTPKGVQTREARNDLVFRARALAANPQGELKRGLPVEVWE
jgi:HlyD family secretion protein